MAQVGLKEASELTGKNQSTIHRAMKSGKLSFSLGENGERLIDTSELDRVFPMRIERNGASNDDSRECNDVQGPGIAELKAQLAAEREKVTLLQAWNDDLRGRLDSEAEERRRTQAQLTALLTDQRQKAEAKAEEPPPRKAWWRFGK